MPVITAVVYVLVFYVNSRDWTVVPVINYQYCSTILIIGVGEYTSTGVMEWMGHLFFRGAHQAARKKKHTLNRQKPISRAGCLE